MLWMQRNAYEESTIRKVAKLLRHLHRNCNTADPEAVKLYVSKKKCGNGHKENLEFKIHVVGNINPSFLFWKYPSRAGMPN